MNNPIDAIIKQASRLPATGLAENYRQRIGSGNPQTKILLIDTSGSMDSTCGHKSERKIDILKRAITRINCQEYLIFSFNSDVEKVESPHLIPEPRGGTALHHAIDVIRGFYPSQTLIICDGEPDDDRAALDAARNLSGIISCLYIGEDNNTAAIQFMRDLSRLGCGKIYVQDITAGSTALGHSIERLLLPGSNF
jgi:hypothetical protein